MKENTTALASRRSAAIVLHAIYLFYQLLASPLAAVPFYRPQRAFVALLGEGGTCICKGVKDFFSSQQQARDILPGPLALCPYLLPG